MERSKDAKKNKSIENEVEPNYSRIDNDSSDEYIDIMNSTTETVAPVILSSIEEDSGDDYGDKVYQGEVFPDTNEIGVSQSEVFKERCLRKMSDKGMLTKLIDNLDAHGNLS